MKLFLKVTGKSYYNKLYANLANYGREGERDTVWFVDNVKKYRRTFSTIVNTLIDAGLTIKN